MKILFIIDKLKIGGKARRFLEIVRGLDRSFEIVLVYYDANTFYEKELKELNVKTYLLKERSKYSLKGFVELNSILKKERPQIVHSWMLIATVKILLLKFLLRFKVIDNSIASADGENLKLTGRLLYAISFRFSDCIIGNSNAGIQSFKAPLSKSVVIHNGFDLGRITNFKPTQLPEKEEYYPVIGMVARFDDNKDYECFFKAANELLKNYPKALFIAIGDGKYFHKYKSEYSQNSGFLFTAAIGNPFDYIQNFDICVLTTYTEGISNSLMEYMAFSKPIITTDCQGTRELLDNGKEAVLIPVSSSQALIDAVNELMNNTSKMKLLGENAFIKLKDSFSFEQMISKYNIIYSKLIN
ncbi:MAG: glycosyltransferase [Bacteroidales bacterium]